MISWTVSEQHLPLKQPLATAAGSISSRQVWLVTVTGADGSVGRGEASPLAGFGGESPELCAARLADLPTEARAAYEAALSWTDSPCAAGAVLGALAERHAVARGMPLATTLALANGDRPLGRIALNALLPDADPERALPLAAQGWSAFKWKSSGDPERDASDAIALRRALGPGARLRLDANASWDLAGAKAFADAARDAALDYVEQPLPPDQDPALAELVPLQLRVALDESIRNLDDLRRACQEAHAEVVVLKPQWLGGWPRLREAVTIARSGHRRRVVLSSSLDGAIGRAHSLHAACALGLDGEAHGLATGALLAEDLGQGPEPSAGWLALPTTPGLGVSNG